MVKSLVGVSAALAMVATPTIARAESCFELRAQLAGTTGDVLQIAREYPKTHAAIIGCFASNERQNDANGCAAGMIILACLGMGGAACADLTNRWQRAASIYQYIAARQRALGCPQ